MSDFAEGKFVGTIVMVPNAAAPNLYAGLVNALPSALSGGATVVVNDRVELAGSPGTSGLARDFGSPSVP